MLSVILLIIVVFFETILETLSLKIEDDTTLSVIFFIFILIATFNNVAPAPPVIEITFGLVDVRLFPEISPFWIRFSILSVILLIISVFFETILVTLSLKILLVTMLSLRFLMIVVFVETMLTTLSLNLLFLSTLSTKLFILILTTASSNVAPAPPVTLIIVGLPLVKSFPEISPF